MIYSVRGWRKTGTCKALHCVQGMEQSLAPSTLTLLSCRSLGKGQLHCSPTCLLGARAELGWQRGLVRWLVLLEHGVTREGEDDYSTMMVSLAFLSLRHRRGKVVGKDGRVACALGLEAAAGPWRPIWLTVSMLQGSGCNIHAAAAFKSAGGTSAGHETHGCSCTPRTGSRGMGRHLSRLQPPA